MSLKGRTLRAGGWVGAGQVFSLTLRLGSTLVMTRLLAPEVFGVMAVVTIAITVMSMLADVGLLPSVVRSDRGEAPEFLNTVWCIQIVRGLLIWLAATLLAWAIHIAQERGVIPAGSTYAEPLLPMLIFVSAFGAIISGFLSTNLYLAYRRLNMKSVVLLDVWVQVSSFAITTLLAWHLRSVWALVIAWLAAAIVHVLLSHLVLAGPRNHVHWDKRSFEEVVSLGRHVMLSSFFSVLALNADRIMLGALVGADLLGLYSIALALSGTAFGVITRVTTTVSLPALSEVLRRGEHEFRSAYFKLRRASDITLLAAAGLTCALGDTVVRVFYDDRYQDAGSILSILGLSLLSSRYAIMQQVYLALGRANYLVWLNVAALLSVLIFVPLAYGMHGFLAAVAAVALKDFATLPLVFFFNHRHGLNDMVYEMKVLLVLPLAYGAGRGVAVALAPWLS